MPNSLASGVPTPARNAADHPIEKRLVSVADESLLGDPREPHSRPERSRLEACPCRDNMAHTRQSRPDSGIGFQVRVLKIFQAVRKGTDKLRLGDPREPHSRTLQIERSED